MKTAKWTVQGMVEKFGGKEYVEADFPETLQELKACKVIRVKADTGVETDFEYSDEKKITNNRRGFGLMFQSASALLTPEEKAEKALDRKAEREAIKELKVDTEMKAKLDAAIARKKEALKAASAK